MEEAERTRLRRSIRCALSHLQMAIQHREIDGKTESGEQEDSHRQYDE